MLDGVLNIYKEKGYTYHDVVDKMRGILRQKKIGHTGTLDPDEEGVLPVCLGKGTRLCDMLTDHSKAVSYTHLDVYKRQGTGNSGKREEYQQSHYVRSNRKLPSDRMQESFW